jgi:predicted nucleic acid-binding protein
VTPKVIVDTGPIVASLDADESHHSWTLARLGELRPPLLTCEAVLTEAAFLLTRVGADPSLVTTLVTRGFLTVVHLFDDDAEALGRLLRRYSNVPMSLADACLVRIVERTANSSVLTLDSDFHIYRQKDRRRIPLLIPTFY